MKKIALTILSLFVMVSMLFTVSACKDDPTPSTEPSVGASVGTSAGTIPNPSEGGTVVDPSQGTVVNPSEGGTVVDPSTGLPVVDPSTGLPVVDPSTGLPVVTPTTSPETEALKDILGAFNGGYGDATVVLPFGFEVGGGRKSPSDPKILEYDKQGNSYYIEWPYVEEYDRSTTILEKVTASYDKDNGSIKFLIELTKIVDTKEYPDKERVFGKDTYDDEGNWTGYNPGYFVYDASKYVTTYSETTEYQLGIYTETGMYMNYKTIYDLDKVNETPFEFMPWADLFKQDGGEVAGTVISTVMDAFNKIPAEEMEAAMSQMIAAVAEAFTLTETADGKTLAFELDLAPVVNSVIKWIDANQNTSVYTLVNTAFAALIGNPEADLETVVLQNLPTLCEMTVEQVFVAVEGFLTQQNTSIENILNEVLPMAAPILNNMGMGEMTTEQILAMITSIRTEYGAMTLGDLAYGLIAQGEPLPEGVTTSEFFASFIGEYLAMAKEMTLTNVVDMLAPSIGMEEGMLSMITAIEAKSLKVSLTINATKENLLTSIVAGYDLDLGMNVPGEAEGETVYNPLVDVDGTYSINVTHGDVTNDYPTFVLPSDVYVTAGETDTVTFTLPTQGPAMEIDYFFVNMAELKADGDKYWHGAADELLPENLVVMTGNTVTVNVAALEALFSEQTSGSYEWNPETQESEWVEYTYVPVCISVDIRMEEVSADEEAEDLFYYYLDVELFPAEAAE